MLHFYLLYLILGQSTNFFMVTYHLILDYYYICTCLKGGDTTLSCGDSFCSGCIAKLIYNKKFNEEDKEGEETNKFIIS